MRERAYLAVSLTHFFVDVLNNGRTLLVALIAVSIGLSNAGVGIALLLYNVSAALSQPLFGHLADRFGPRWLVVGGMGWMIFFYTLASVATDWPALVALTIAGFGSGAFHPTGAMVASQTAPAYRTRATAVFFMAGQMGLFAGPVLAGIFLEAFDRPGYLALPLLSLTALASGWRWVGNTTETPAATAVSPAPPAHPVAPGRPERANRAHLIPLVTIILLVSTVNIATLNFVPKLFTEWGLSPGYVGWTAGLFMMGAAFGGVAGGSLADRFSGRLAILAGSLGAILPLYLYIPSGDPWRLLLLLAAGFFMGMPHSVLVIKAQSLMPRRRALASGLILGFMFFSGAVGSYAVGIIADQIGLAIALQYLASLGLLSAATALFLKD